ncbi:MAG: thioredoxin [Candidatus Babeliales bacterium]
MAIVITKENFEKEIVQSKLPIIIDVFATWCGPCQQMMPIFHELEQELGNQYKFAKINVDEARELSIQYGVTSVPTFIFIKDNQVKAKETGYMSKEELIEKIEDVFK